VIDGHSHLLMSGGGREKRGAADLTEVDLDVLFVGLDRLGIERVVSLVQDTTRIWRSWTGTNDLAIDLQVTYPDRFPDRVGWGTAGSGGPAQPPGPAEVGARRQRPRRQGLVLRPALQPHPGQRPERVPGVAMQPLIAGASDGG